MTNAADNALLTQLRRSAMDLLARREHSRVEIANKLRRHYAEYETQFPQVLDQLEQDNLLSDERFAEAYVRYRKEKGFGPLLIQQELRGKGIARDLLEACIDVRSEDWLHKLKDLVAKKQRLLGPTNSDFAAARKTQQKLYRFCLSRGFTPDQIERALSFLIPS